MSNDFIILSYHKFVEEPSDYRFSRTYEQFGHDISKKIYDQIHIDDGMSCMIKACEMLRYCNIRAKLFICTSLIETPGYCTWGELRELSKYHDIENHSHIHRDHTKETYEWQFSSIRDAQMIITDQVGKAPRYFAPPYNQFNHNTENVAADLGLRLVMDRINVLNISK